jgi:hypothetical protein
VCPSNNEKLNFKKFCNILGMQNGVDGEVCILGSGAAHLAVNTDIDWGV